VPAGKELVRPEACFVVKAHIHSSDPPRGAQSSGQSGGGQSDSQSGGGSGGGNGGESKGEKLFVNIVQSAKIGAPVGTQRDGGMQWSLPLCLGPRRLEADKGGAKGGLEGGAGGGAGGGKGQFDVCFHPKALALVRESKQFKEYLITTALAQVWLSFHGGEAYMKERKDRYFPIKIGHLLVCLSRHVAFQHLVWYTFG
jgi:hypothetical protein